MEERALFVRDGDAFVGTILTQGSWDPGAANGAMVLALLGHCLEDVPTLVPMTVSRFTTDLVRPVPLGRRLRVTADVVREGKKIQVVELRLVAEGAGGEAVEHVRATVLRLRDADLSGRDDVPASTTDVRPADALEPVAEAEPVRQPGADLPGFLRAVDMRRARRRDRPGYGWWVRLEAAVVAGEPVRPTSLLTLGFDISNLIGLEEVSAAVTMINPDVTAHVLRPPVGEWLAVTGDTRVNPALGRGVSTAELSDGDGIFALTSVSQLVQPR
ncbi:MAG TPA: acyl-CoA thioesterase domain-containing protein [Acidimicrobiales bacterium]